MKINTKIYLFVLLDFLLFFVIHHFLSDNGLMSAILIGFNVFILSLFSVWIDTLDIKKKNSK